VDPDSRATLWALIRTYSSLLARIEERGFDVFSSRVSLSSAEKIQFLLMAGVTGWWKRDALAKRSGDRRRLAGLASAVALAEAGVEVQLFEKRPHLGGRATSYTLPDGTEVDNCQHVTLGCCTNLADFYRRAGASGKLRFYDRLYFVDRDGRRSTIQASRLPPPLHMAWSFLFFDALTFADKRELPEPCWRLRGRAVSRQGLNRFRCWSG